MDTKAILRDIITELAKNDLIYCHHGEVCIRENTCDELLKLLQEKLDFGRKGFLAKYMTEGEAERLEEAVINAALDWTAAARRMASPDVALSVVETLYKACRALHMARENAFAKQIME